MLAQTSSNVYLEDPDGVDVSRARTPATEEDNGRSLGDVALPPSLVQSSQQSLVHILKPVTIHWSLIEKRVDPSVEMALRIETESYCIYL